MPQSKTRKKSGLLKKTLLLAALAGGAGGAAYHYRDNITNWAQGLLEKKQDPDIKEYNDHVYRLAAFQRKIEKKQSSDELLKFEDEFSAIEASHRGIFEKLEERRKRAATDTGRPNLTLEDLFSKLKGHELKGEFSKTRSGLNALNARFKAARANSSFQAKLNKLPSIPAHVALLKTVRKGKEIEDLAYLLNAGKFGKDRSKDEFNAINDLLRLLAERAEDHPNPVLIASAAQVAQRAIGKYELPQEHKKEVDELAESINHIVRDKYVNAAREPPRKIVQLPDGSLQIHFKYDFPLQSHPFKNYGSPGKPITFAPVELVPLLTSFEVAGSYVVHSNGVVTIRPGHVLGPSLLSFTISDNFKGPQGINAPPGLLTQKNGFEPSNSAPSDTEFNRNALHFRMTDAEKQAQLKRIGEYYVIIDKEVGEDGLPRVVARGWSEPTTQQEGEELQVPRVTLDAGAIGSEKQDASMPSSDEPAPRTSTNESESTPEEKAPSNDEPAPSEVEPAPSEDELAPEKPAEENAPREEESAPEGRFEKEKHRGVFAWFRKIRRPPWSSREERRAA